MRLGKDGVPGLGDGGLEGGEDGILLENLFFLLVLGPLLEEDVREVLVGGIFLEFGFGGEKAVGGVEDDLFDVRLGLGLVRGSGGGFGEVLEGDLEAVEEEAGAAGVELVAGDAGEDFADRELDGGAVFGHGEGEGSLAGAAAAEVLDGFARGVVEVAEGLAAEAGRAAAAAFGEDVAALETFGLGGRFGGWHDGWSPHGTAFFGAGFGILRVGREPGWGAARPSFSSTLIIANVSRGYAEFEAVVRRKAERRAFGRADGLWPGLLMARVNACPSGDDFVAAGLR